MNVSAPQCLRLFSFPLFCHIRILYGSAAVSHIIHSQGDIEKRERRNGKMETHQRLGPITEMQETKLESASIVSSHSSTEQGSIFPHTVTNLPPSTISHFSRFVARGSLTKALHRRAQAAEPMLYFYVTRNIAVCYAVPKICICSLVSGVPVFAGMVTM